MIIEGNVSVKAAILGNQRKVNCVYVDVKKHDPDTKWILHRALEKNIPVYKKTREEIDTYTTGKTHGGLIADCEARKYQSIEQCYTDATFLCILEGVEDPFNLGYVIRTLYSAGCTGLIIRKRDWSSVEPIILKSSAGAYEYLHIVESDDIPALLQDIKKKGVMCYAAMRKDAISCYAAKFTQPVLLAIGGEMRGLSKAVLQQMDQNIYIPYANDFHMALNAAGASAVLAFEVLRQRNNCFPTTNI